MAAPSCTLRIVVVALTTALAGCAANWNLQKPTLVGGGEQMCSVLGTKERIWEAETSGDQAVDCAVDVSYRAPEHAFSACSATLYWKTGDGGTGPGDGPVRAGQPKKSVAIPKAHSIEMSCQGTGEDTNEKCSYEINKVSCAKPGDVVTVVDQGLAVPRNSVGCGAAVQQIWTQPAGKQSCNVTVLWTAPAHCTGIVSANYPGNSIDSETAPKRSKLKTFVGPLKLDFECKNAGTGPGAGENCTYAIVSEECK